MTNPLESLLVEHVGLTEKEVNDLQHETFTAPDKRIQWLADEWRELKAQIAELRAQVAELTAERDAARSALLKVWRHVDENMTFSSEIIEQLQRAELAAVLSARPAR